MKNMVSQLAALALLMGDTGAMHMKGMAEKRRIIPNKPPGNSKEYWFNERGYFSTEKMLKTDVVFSCYAVNDKNAIRKFNKWKTKNDGRM